LCAVRLQRALCALYCERIAAAISLRRFDSNAQRDADRESASAQAEEARRIGSPHEAAGNRRGLRTLQDARGGKGGRDQDDGVETETGFATGPPPMLFEVI
jgi:hypothetical protein